MRAAILAPVTLALLAVASSPVSAMCSWHYEQIDEDDCDEWDCPVFIAAKPEVEGRSAHFTGRIEEIDKSGGPFKAVIGVNNMTDHGVVGTEHCHATLYLDADELPNCRVGSTISFEAQYRHATSSGYSVPGEVASYTCN